MTNKELAAQCLIEAAELLGESAGRNGAFDREYATKELNKIKRIPDEEYRNKMLKDNLFDLEKEARTGKTYLNNDKSPLYKGKGYFEQMGGRRRRREVMDPDYVHEFDSEYQRKKKFNQKINHNAELAEARKKLAAAKDEFDRRKRENDELRKAAKNESVDIDALLEEAMDLLDY